MTTQGTLTEVLKINSEGVVQSGKSISFPNGINNQSGSLFIHGSVVSDGDIVSTLSLQSGTSISATTTIIAGASITTDAKLIVDNNAFLASESIIYTKTTHVPAFNRGTVITYVGPTNPYFGSMNNATGTFTFSRRGLYNIRTDFIATTNGTEDGFMRIGNSRFLNDTVGSFKSGADPVWQIKNEDLVYFQVGDTLIAEIGSSANPAGVPDGTSVNALQGTVNFSLIKIY